LFTTAVCLILRFKRRRKRKERDLKKNGRSWIVVRPFVVRRTVDRNVFTEMSEEREIRKKPERLGGPISDLRGLEVGAAGEGFGQKFYRIAKDQRILLRNRQN
jgi:hypothetical protein